MMNSEHEIDASMMLQSFLDGELPPEKEESLFLLMSQSSDLRAEMRDLLAIRSAVQHDMKSLVPPVETTRALFGTLGFTAPTAAVVERAMETTLLMMLRKHWIPITTVVLLSLGSYWVFSGSDKDASSRVNVRSETQHPEPTVVTPKSEAELHTSQAVNQAQPRTVARTVTAQSHPSTTPTQNFDSIEKQYQNLFSASNDAAAIASSSSEQRELTARSVSIATNVSTPEAQSPTVFTRPLFFDPEKTTLLLFVQLRSTSRFAGRKTVVPSQRNPFYENTALTVCFPLSERQQLGLEAGLEAYPQFFSRTEFGLPVVYEQNPMQYWLTAVYRYSFGDLFFPGLQPFGQVNLGAAMQLGPLGRVSLGIRYALHRQAQLSAAVEGSMAMYQFESKWLSTSKFGVSYGFAIQF